MTDWLSLCRACVTDLERVLVALPSRVEREPVLRLGEGGDETTAVDGAAEDAVVARLEALGEDFVLVSEELGERVFGSGGRTRVVLDPIDGSVNAKRGIPYFALSLAVADGPAMGDVRFGYVYDFGAQEEWVRSHAVRVSASTASRSLLRRRRIRSRFSRSRARRPCRLPRRPRRRSPCRSASA